ncbi:PREDICTED: uncharacterized protein LOC108360980 [Rhagoletis zephyria]|uniref:uncharacterized protein LOC108360980 n=1 Tax=Rhagoletis zephyria TaxID=28612 RepID=UPI0008119E26|nr:PREDICTED: uncharacterized protein LOC108360980 [Rhagoletis zephyria]
MVHHFECTKQRQVQPESKEEPLTINNQIPARRVIDCAQAAASVGVAEVKQVTVNNHINVPMTTYAPDDVKSAKVISDEFDRTNYKDNKSEIEKTYQSSAMDIRLSTGEQRKSQDFVGESIDGGGDTNGTLKVWRNKNVDLAYTIAMKQSDGNSKAAQTMSTTVASMKRILESNMPLKSCTRIDDNASCEKGKEASALPEKINFGNMDAKQPQRTVDNWQAPQGEQHTAATQAKIQAAPAASATTTTTPILAPRSTQLPAQIVVPVEIHRVDQQTPEPYGRTSVASSRGSSVTTVIATSTTTLLDKSVVRHYVANDKSLFEKRKYDDIEFEEFEVYDPTKDFEKLIENEKRREEAKREAQQQRGQLVQHGTQLAQQAVGGKLVVAPAWHSIGDKGDDDDDDHEEEEEEEDGRKSKVGSDCYDYDSLEDKL